MKRRRFVQALAAAPAVPVLVAQQPASPAAAPPGGGFGTIEDLQKLDTASADDVASMVPKFFNAGQFAALRHLSSTMMPPMKGMPGALDAKAAEFLDFLIGKSLANRQQLYRVGLDTLNAESSKRFNQPFGKLDSVQVAGLLGPVLKRPWTYDPAVDPLERFLRAFKQDVRTATINSKEYSAAVAASGGAAGGGGGRRGGGGGLGLYWLRLE